MPQPINRRGFINTLFLVTAVPSALGEKPPYTVSSTTPTKSALENLKPVDDQFFSVDGWILPTKTLTRGAV